MIEVTITRLTIDDVTLDQNYRQNVQWMFRNRSQSRDRTRDYNNDYMRGRSRDRYNDRSIQSCGRNESKIQGPTPG